MLNKQIPIKQDLTKRLSLAVNSIFFTIQGEGIFVGHPAVFIRLAGCNLQCPACDTEYTTSIDLPVSSIYDQVVELSRGIKIRPIVVITGGEPFRQDISHLVNCLMVKGFKVQIETNGTLYVNLNWGFAHRDLTIICSPKTGKINKDLLPHIKAFKYVVHADKISPVDGLPITALDHTASPQVARPPEGHRARIYVQPIDVQDPVENKRHLAAAVESCMTHGYSLCMQVHKILGLE